MPYSQPIRRSSRDPNNFRSPDVRHQHRSGGKEVATKLGVFHRGMCYAEGGYRHPPEDLSNDRVHIDQRRAIVEVRKTVGADNCVKFLLSLLLYLRIR